MPVAARVPGGHIVAGGDPDRSVSVSAVVAGQISGLVMVGHNPVRGPGHNDLAALANRQDRLQGPSSTPIRCARSRCPRLVGFAALE